MIRPFDTITPQKFQDELRRYRNGSVTRRHFLGVTGLGAAALAGAVPGLEPRKAHAALSGTVSVTTWPNYFAQENLDSFTKTTGVAVDVTVLGSNEAMLAKLQAGSTGWDVFVPTDDAISACRKLDLIQPLDLRRLPNYDPSTQDTRFLGSGTIDGTTYAVPRNWGTSGFCVNTRKVNQAPASWKEFWDLMQGPLSGKVVVQDSQIATIGSALKYFGYSFNSIEENELADAEKLLLAAKPHLLAITSDIQPAIRDGDAWMSLCCTGDAAQLHRDLPEIAYVLGKEGGEIWVDHYAIAKDAPNLDAAYALIDYLLTPAINAMEVQAHGYPATDARCTKLVPRELLDNPILYPAREALAPLEFGIAEALTNPLRAEIMARFKAA